MGLFNHIANLITGGKSQPSHKETKRRGRFEQMEPRRMLDADPLHVGAVFIEGDAGQDNTADTFEITFEGGAAGTQLTQVVIDGDQTPLINGILAAGDIFFDTEATGFGADVHQDFGGVTKVGAFTVTPTVQDGTTNLVLTFQNFTAGDKLIFHLDVDEVVRTDLDNSAAPAQLNTADPNTLTSAQLDYLNLNGFDPIASGVEFHGTHFSASFTAPGHQDITGTGDYHNVYTTKAADGTQLNLTEDNAGGQRDRTDGVLLTLQQKEIPITIAGTVYHDRNLSKDQDVGTEEGIAGVTLKLYKKDAGGVYQDTGFTTTTDANGDYKFDVGLNLTSGTYRVVEEQPIDYKYSTVAEPGSVNAAASGQTVAGDLNVITEISIPLGGQHSIDNDFGEAKPAEISGFVYHDANDNGIKDVGEQGIGGVNITVTPGSTIDPSQTPVTVTTLADGSYKVSGLAPGEYRVTEGVVPPEYFDGKDTAGTVDNTAANYGVAGNDEINAIKLASLSVGTNYNFGEIKFASIRGNVSLTDADGNCVDHTDPSRVGVAGATVRLYDAGGALIKEVTTDSNGDYVFDKLKPGVYRIEEVTPTNLLDGGHHVGTINGTVVGVKAGSDATSPNGTDVIAQVSLKAGEDAVNYDFCEHKPASLSGLVWHDRNDDGIRQAATEEVIAGVDIKLVDDKGVTIATTKTDANGKYSFTKLLAGDYTVMETTPTGYIDGQENIGTVGGVTVGNDSVNDVFSQVSLKTGEQGVNYDFGELKPASLSGTVWHDRNNDGVRQPGSEEVIAGVDIKLVDSKGVTVATTKTDANGKYSFTNLTPGVYTVMETTPSGFIDGKENIGTIGGAKVGNDSVNDVFSQIALASAQQGVNYDFGELKPSQISGYVHAESDGDCIREPGETLLSGVIMTLTNNDTGQTFVTQTDVNGYYEFNNLVAGNYSITQTQPSAYADPGHQKAGTAGGDASVDNKITNIQLNSDVHSQNNDFCEHDSPPPISDPPPVVIPTPPTNPIPAAPVAPLNTVTAPTITSFSPPVATPGATNTFVNGYSSDIGYSWHLSVVDGGNPRAVTTPFQNVAFSDRFKSEDFDQGTFKVSIGDEVREFTFGLPGAKAIVGDFNGDGVDELGLFVDGEWFLDLNGDGVFDNSDLWAQLGKYEDQPVVGDWDGDGKDDIGIFGPEWEGDDRHVSHEAGLPDADNTYDVTDYRNKAHQEKNLPPTVEEATNDRRVLQLTERGKARADLIDHVFRYGEAKEIAITGDWNGDGIKTIGLFSDGRWNLDTDGDGRFSELDEVVYFGRGGDVPVVGDFNGDGVDDLGVFHNGEFRLDADANHRADDGDKIVNLGRAGDQPLVGDFDGDGIDEPAIYRESEGPIDRQARLGGDR